MIAVDTIAQGLPGILAGPLSSIDNVRTNPTNFQIDAYVVLGIVFAIVLVAAPMTVSRPERGGTILGAVLGGLLGGLVGAFIAPFMFPESGEVGSLMLGLVMGSAGGSVTGGVIGATLNY